MNALTQHNLEISNEQLDFESSNSSPPKNSLLKRLSTFMNNWYEFSYQAWVKSGRPDNF
jgi:hypothetical protein